VFFRKGAAYGIAILKNNFVLAALVGRRLQPALLRRGKNSSLPKNIGGTPLSQEGKKLGERAKPFMPYSLRTGPAIAPPARDQRKISGKTRSGKKR
jgi:hypothetical protein